LSIVVIEFEAGIQSPLDVDNMAFWQATFYTVFHDVKLEFTIYL